MFHKHTDGNFYSDKKKDVPKPKAEELEEKESPIAKPNSEKALEDNLAVSDVADVELLESGMFSYSLFTFTSTRPFETIFYKF